MRGAVSARLIYSQHLLCGRASWPSPSRYSCQHPTADRPNVLEELGVPSGTGPGAAKVQRLYEQRTKSFHRYLTNVIDLRSNLIMCGPHVLERRICLILKSTDHKSVNVKNVFSMYPRIKWMFSNSWIVFSAQIELWLGPPPHSTTKQFRQTTR